LYCIYTQKNLFFFTSGVSQFAGRFFPYIIFDFYRYSVRVILLLLFVIIIIFRYCFARCFRRRENRFVSGFTGASRRHDFTVMSRRRHRRCCCVKPEQFRAYDRVHLPHVIIIRSTPYTTPFTYLTTITYVYFTGYYLVYPASYIPTILIYSISVSIL